MAKIKFKDNLIVLSRTMNMEKDVFENGINDEIYAEIKQLFSQHGWTPITDLHHEPNGDKIAICLEFTVPQTETTCSTKWLHLTDKLMHAILFHICAIIDHRDDLNRAAKEFKEETAENNIIWLPAPKEEKCKRYALTVYDTGNHVDIFNVLIKTDCKSRTTWKQGWTISLMMDEPEKENLHKRLCEIGCEHSLKQLN